MNKAEVRSQERWRELVQTTALRVMRVPVSQRPQPVSIVEGAISSRRLPARSVRSWLKEAGEPRLSIVQVGRATSELAQVALVVLTRPAINPGTWINQDWARAQTLTLGQMTFLLDIGRWFMERLTQNHRAEMLPPSVVPGSYFEELLIEDSGADCFVLTVPFELARVCAGQLAILIQPRLQQAVGSELEPAAVRGF